MFSKLRAGVFGAVTIAIVGLGSGALAEEGIAAWYAGKGGKMVAAHKTLPFGSQVTVTNLSNGRKVVVRITDRGPFTKGRIIDLSRDAAKALGIDGIARVSVE